MPTKTKTRRVKSPDPIRDYTEFTSEVDSVANQQVLIDEIKAERDKRIQEIQESFNGRIKTLEAGVKITLGRCEKYASARKTALFSKAARSAETALARFGFQMGKPALAIKGRGTWAAVADALRAAGKRSLLRFKVEVNKDAVMTRVKDHPNRDDYLAEYGMRFTQVDRFYIEPKTEGGEKVKGES